MEMKIGDKIATREGYGHTLVELGATHDFVVLDADLAEATKTCYFHKAFPERFFDCGIAEGNMIGIAAGLATTGKTVFASSFAMFAAGRAFEQIRNSVAYPNLDVKVAATHAGITVGEDGATHQCLEDLALMRSIPGMRIINPADAVEAAEAVRVAMETPGPFYLRFGRSAVPVVHDQATYRLELGKGELLADGSDVTIVATGIMVSVAMQAVDMLKNEGISARLINMHTIKPIDREILEKAARETGALITAEEHNIIGGLGSAVAEAIAETYPVPVLRVGVNDEFGRSGKVPPLMERYGLTADAIVAKVKQAIAMKQ